MTFYHSGSMGDIIYSLPTIIALGGGNLYIKKEAQYYTLRRLIAIQPAIDQVLCGHAGTSLDGYRTIERKAFKENSGGKHLAQCHLEALGVEFDLTKPWLFSDVASRVIVPFSNSPRIWGRVEPYIIVSRSTRYHDKEKIDWKLLKQYANTIFIGYDKEYRAFEKVAEFSPLRLICEDALIMAEVIKGSALFIGNQSLAFAIAEALKHPRVLEVYHKNSNCIPNGADGYTYLNQEVIEKYCGSRNNQIKSS